MESVFEIYSRWYEKERAEEEEEKDSWALVNSSVEVILTASQDHHMTAATPQVRVSHLGVGPFPK